MVLGGAGAYYVYTDTTDIGSRITHSTRWISDQGKARATKRPEPGGGAIRRHLTCARMTVFGVAR